MGNDIAKFIGGSYAASEPGSQFLVGVDFNKLQTSLRDQQTDTLSLGEPPPQIDGLIVELYRRTVAQVLFAVRVIFVTIAQMSVGYLVLFLPTILLAKTVEFSFPKVESFLPPFLVGVIGVLPFQSTLFVCIFVTLYVLNYYLDIFWRLQFVPMLMVPTWIVFQARSNFEKIIDVDANSLHFGLLKVRYEYNESVFFVRAASDHFATVMHFETIKNVDVDYRSGTKWRGKHGTPPVVLFLEEGRQRSFLRIHGAYFEENGPGTAKAEAFKSGLQSSLQAYRTSRTNH